MKLKNNIYKKSAFDTLRAAALPFLFTGAIVIMIVFGLRQTGASSNAEGMRILEESIRRAAITGYAVEGRYPESLEYIETQYGIYIDRTKYAVHYSVFASNIMPEIVVIEVN